MGVCAELCAKEHGVSRAEQDAFAAESHRRASAAAAAGWFSAETVAVSVPQKRGPPKVVATNEGLGKGGDAAALAKLAPVFQKTGGSVTAGNSSGLSDGAAALVLASGDAVRRLGLRPIGVLRGFGEAACEPERFTTAPSLAVPIALAAAGLRPEDISVRRPAQVLCSSLHILFLTARCSVAAAVRDQRGVCCCQPGQQQAAEP